MCTYDIRTNTIAPVRFHCVHYVANRVSWLYHPTAHSGFSCNLFRQHERSRCFRIDSVGKRCKRDRKHVLASTMRDFTMRLHTNRVCIVGIEQRSNAHCRELFVWNSAVFKPLTKFNLLNSTWCTNRPEYTLCIFEDMIMMLVLLDENFWLFSVWLLFLLKKVWHFTISYVFCIEQSNYKQIWN